MQRCIARMVQSINEGTVVTSEKSNHSPSGLDRRVLKRAALPLNQPTCIEPVASAACSCCAVQRTATCCYK
jgi:hypothetical protein